MVRTNSGHGMFESGIILAFGGLMALVSEVSIYNSYKAKALLFLKVKQSEHQQE